MVMHLVNKNIIVGIYRYRSFILGSVKREFISRYNNSILGVAWLVLNPLAQILVYTLVFSEVMRARLPNSGSPFGFGIFLCAGLLTWGLFSDILKRCQNMFIDNANLLKKNSIPHICITVIAIISAFLEFAIIFLLFVGFLLLSGNLPGWVLLYLVPLLMLQTLLSAGLGLVIGVLNVFFRDVGQSFGIILQFWFWLTPIVYPMATIPNTMQRFLMLNPMTPLAIAYQGIFVEGLQPEWVSLWPVALLACIFCFFGFYLIKNYAGDMVDEL